MWKAAYEKGNTLRTTLGELLSVLSTHEICLSTVCSNTFLNVLFLLINKQTNFRLDNESPHDSTRDYTKQPNKVNKNSFFFTRGHHFLFRRSTVHIRVASIN